MTFTLSEIQLWSFVLFLLGMFAGVCITLLALSFYKWDWWPFADMVKAKAKDKKKATR